MTVVGKLIKSIGSFIEHPFNGAEKGFNALPPDQQKGAIDGSQISQIIKTGYAKGEAAVIAEICQVTGLSESVASQTVLSIAKDAGVNTTSIQAYLDHVADTIQAGVTDNKWNALWEDVAKFAASYLTQGKLNWVSLGMGVIQFAFQQFVNPAHK